MIMNANDLPQERNDKRRCHSIKRDGERCTKRTSSFSRYCHLHQNWVSQGLSGLIGLALGVSIPMFIEYMLAKKPVIQPWFQNKVMSDDTVYHSPCKEKSTFRLSAKNSGDEDIQSMTVFFTVSETAVRHLKTDGWDSNSSVGADTGDTHVKDKDNKTFAILATPPVRPGMHCELYPVEIDCSQFRVVGFMVNYMGTGCEMVRRRIHFVFDNNLKEESVLSGTPATEFLFKNYGIQRSDVTAAAVKVPNQ